MATYEISLNHAQKLVSLTCRPCQSTLLIALASPAFEIGVTSYWEIHSDCTESEARPRLCDHFSPN